RPLSFYLNPAAFVLPAIGSYGTLGRNVFVGPVQWSFDAAISRAFQFQETKRVEFRAEAFNMTNSFMASNPALNLSQNTFGQIRTARDPRILQFALKYVF